MRAEREGSFGRLRAEDATSLAMIIGELVHNAVEHGLAAGGGTVQVQAERSVEDGEERLQVRVADDGQGLPDGLQPRPRGPRRPGHADRHLAGAGPARPDHLGTGEAARNRGAVRRAASAGTRMRATGEGRSPSG